MKTLVEKWETSKKESFIIKKITASRPINAPEEVFMRVHDDYEISVLLGGSGKRFIGNTIENLPDGDIFFIGPQVPHFIQLDPGQKMKGITIHFLKDAFGEGFFELPENHRIAMLLKDSRLGISFKNLDLNTFYDKMEALISLGTFDRMIALFKLLQELSLLPDRKKLSSRGFNKFTHEKDYLLVNKTYNYIINRFEDQNISLDDISSHVNMSPATFCRYFKKHFHKTFTNFLNEVRIGHACKKLQETNKNISEIAYASGYNHLTHFNKQFKKIMGYSPKEYRRALH